MEDIKTEQPQLNNAKRNSTSRFWKMRWNRIDVPRKAVIDEMRATNPNDVEKVREFFKVADSVTCKELNYDGKVNAMTPRQYTVAEASFAKAAREMLSESWWEMLDFVEDRKEE